MIDIEELRRSISYDPETGVFTRLVTKGRWRAGRIDLRPDGPLGRVRMTVNGKAIQATQVAWALMTGEWPSHGVQCANGDRTDIRWNNLEPCILSMQELLPSGGELSQDVLKRILDYSPETGVFRWRISVVQHRSGKEAGFLTASNYVKIGFAGREYFAHRLAWLWMTGSWPASEIDHIDGVRANNSWANLRAATRSENLENQRVARSNNQHSRLLGASLHKQSGKWVAQIKSNGKREYLGLFDTAELAHEAYVARKRQIHSHGML